MWLTRRPVKHQRSSPAYSLPARLSLLHLDTGGILAGRLVSSLSHGHGPHLDFGHPDPQLTPGYFTAPQPDGLEAHTDESASVCTVAEQMAPDSGPRWNLDLNRPPLLEGWNVANLHTARSTLVITN